MLSSTVGLAVHLYSSLRSVQSIGRVLGYVLPYSNMAAVKAKRNFDSKHLTKGDPLPPFNGKLRVFNMRYCPYAQRTILALNAKDIDYEIINIDLMEKPEWLTSKSAFAKVPAIEIAEGVTIYESLVTVEYLDEVYPHRPLLPKDPLLKAKDKIIVEAMGGIHSLFFKLVKSPDTITKQTIDGYLKALDFIQAELQQRGTRFLDGEQPGYADYMIWPWFERIILFDTDIAKMDEQKYKLLLAYIEDMLKDPVVSEYMLPRDAFLQLSQSYKDGTKPNYDYLLNKSH